MPLDVVDVDLAAGALVEFTIEDAPPHALVMPMSAVYRADKPPGPAGRSLLERLKQILEAR
jgi:DNA-binding transcriptional LysR family regulator